jgi:hypothetical protein
MHMHTHTLTPLTGDARRAVAQLGEYIAALEIRFDLNLTFLRICQMVLQLIFLAHILGCFWFYIASLVGLDPEIATWVAAYDEGSGIDADPETQYLYSLYWALTTLTTVRVQPPHTRGHAPPPPRARSSTCCGFSPGLPFPAACI